MHFFGHQSSSGTGHAYAPPRATPDVARCYLAELAIERIVAVQPSLYGLDNSYQLRGALDVGIPARFVLCASRDVSDDDLERWDALGGRGLRFMPAHGGRSDSAEIEYLAGRLGALGWHIELFATISQLADMEPLLTRLGCEVSIAHFGLVPLGSGNEVELRNLLRLLSRGRTWLKLSAPYRCAHGSDRPFADASAQVRKLIDEVPDKLLWASDWPHAAYSGRIPSFSELRASVFQWFPDESLRKRILVDNPANLYGF